MQPRIISGPPLELPTARTLPDMARERARKTPDAPVLIDAATGNTTSALDLMVGFERAARGLAAQGFQRGDCLCTLMGNDMSWYVAALAAQSLGGSVSGINPLATPDEIARQFAAVPARAILAAPPLLPLAQSIAGRLGIDIVVATAPNDDGAPTLAELDGPALRTAVEVNRDDIALLPFSSGTSGLPKPVMVTHRNLIAGGTQIPTVLGVTPADRLLALAPLFHIVGPSLLPVALGFGAPLVVVPRFDPALVLDAIERRGVTIAPLLTPILRALSRHPAGEGRDWSRLRIIAAGGAAMAPSDHAEAAERFGCAVLQVYGMTETSSIIAVDAPDDIAPGTCGRPAPGLSLRITDPETGDVLPQGVAGEIQLCGPNVVSGYLDLAEETARSFTPDGWLRTGDLGAVGEDGRLSITGRFKELIKVHSAQVAPAELEILLAAHPAVAEAAVIGRPNRHCGEAPIAWIVPVAPVDPFEVLDWVNDQVIRYKRLRGIEVTDALPKNATGKLDRRKLAEMDRATVTGGRAGGTVAGAPGDALAYRSNANGAGIMPPAAAGAPGTVPPVKARAA